MVFRVELVRDRVERRQETQSTGQRARAEDRMVLLGHVKLCSLEFLRTTTVDPKLAVACPLIGK